MRIVDAAEAVAAIRSGDQVYVHCAAATPSVLLDALVARAPELAGRRRRPPPHRGPGPHLAPEMAGHFRHRALFIGPNARAAVNEGRADYVPGVPLATSRDLFDSGDDPARRGARQRDAARRARVLLAGHLGRGDARGRPRREDRDRPVQPLDAADPRRQLRPRRPTSTSASRSTSRPTSTRPTRIGEVERRIGGARRRARPRRRDAPDGHRRDPGRDRPGPHDKRDLGIHTEMFTDVVVDLVEAGVVTGARKERNRGKIVAAFMMGTQRLYDFVDDNPMVEMRPVDFTNDTHVIRAFRRMTAINSAIEVDLDRPGRAPTRSAPGCTAASAARWTSSGVRRSPTRVARSSRCPSTAAGGTVSRIVATLQEGAGVVTTRAHARTVVTEWGVAELYGKSMRERAAALIAIAHPDHRDELIGGRQAQPPDLALRGRAGRGPHGPGPP